MIKCSRCGKRPAVVFISKIENGETKQEGLCLKCAKELGIKPVNDILGQMGISEDDLDRVSDFMSDEDNMAALEQFVGDTGDESDDDAENSARAPAIDFSKLMRESGLAEKPESSGAGSSEKSKKSEPRKSKKENKFLNSYCENMTAKARSGLLDRIIGRDRDLDRVIQILCRRQKNNPCLIGEPGVGKTAIAEALAQRIAAGNVPYKLKNKEIFLVDLTALVAGTQFRGQFESRVLGLLNEVKSAGNVILVIDEVHNIVGAGDAEGSMNAANIMKPALSRGEIQVIGATTMTEYRKYIEKDSALERRFQPVVVAEPSLDDTEKILNGIKHYYEEFHGIRIPENVLRTAVTMSERYITDRYLPDKAIDLIDEAASRISLTSPEINERYEVADRLLALSKEREEVEKQLETEADEAKKGDMFHKIADIKVEEIRLTDRIAELKKVCDTVEMTTADLADVIEIWTGVPASTITEDEFVRLDTLEERLKSRIVGQDTAVSAVVRAIKRNRTGISPKRKPVSFIFAGPTGVGKTELVKVLADDLFNSPETLIRLDMSEYMDKFSVSRIIGAPPGYVGYDDAGQLTEKIRRRPYSVVLFDEIEKAHPDVMNILLQILDDGRITDARGKQVSFENTVIVMTTNAGSEGSAAMAGFSTSAGIVSADKTEKALAQFLRPEFLNRIDEIITFNSLSHDNFVAISTIMLGDLAKALAEKYITFTYTESAARYIADKSYSSKYGARNMRRFIQREVEDKIAEAVVSGRGSVRAIKLDCADDGLSVITMSL